MYLTLYLSIVIWQKDQHNVDETCKICVFGPEDIEPMLFKPWSQLVVEALFYKFA